MIGEVDVNGGLSDEDKEIPDANLRRSGLELMNDRKSQIIEKIKNVIIDMVHYTEDMQPVNFSNVLTEKLDLDYTYLSNLFSDVTGTTIQQFIIKHKIERVKELLVYDELNISEIAWKPNYSSVQHLSTQFKKVTGLSPSHFKTLRKKRRQSIIEIG
ncbi:MAG: helix-turn-helix transcriptional regulator [Candidatus Kapabacteria bacterium]|nr:helix-turn-helix transcriptional regulator [Candidatus Kapabacteria bacterium]